MMHTKPLVSSFTERPKTKRGWRALWYGLSGIAVFPVLGVFGALVVPLMGTSVGVTFSRIVGFLAGILGIGFISVSLYMGMCAIREGERSWAVWVGFVPFVILGIFLLGEFLVPH